MYIIIDHTYVLSHLCVYIYIHPPKLWSKIYSTLYAYSIYTYIHTHNTWGFIPLIPLDKPGIFHLHASAQLPNLLVLVLFAAPEAQWLGGHSGERDPGTGCPVPKRRGKPHGETRKIIYIHGGFSTM
jgi:hypothetical protein